MQPPSSPGARSGNLAQDRASGPGPPGGEGDARIRIRDAALEGFAAGGYEHTTVRAVAHAAGVSHGMVRHHFGSKLALRDACDDYVLDLLRRQRADNQNSTVPAVAESWTSNLLLRYIARSMVDGSPSADPLFEELVALAARDLGQAGDSEFGDDPDLSQAKIVLFATLVCSIPLLSDLVSRSLGMDVLSPEGAGVILMALLDTFSQGEHGSLIDSLTPCG